MFQELLSTSVFISKDLIDMDSTTKHGYDKLDIVMHFMPLLNCDKSANKLKSEYNRFKSYLVFLIKRGVTNDEEIKLNEGIIAYVKSDPGTDDRMKAMNYLFGLEFIETV